MADSMLPQFIDIHMSQIGSKPTHARAEEWLTICQENQSPYAWEDQAELFAMMKEKHQG